MTAPDPIALRLEAVDREAKDAATAEYAKHAPDDLDTGPFLCGYVDARIAERDVYRRALEAEMQENATQEELRLLHSDRIQAKFTELERENAELRGVLVRTLVPLEVLNMDNYNGARWMTTELRAAISEAVGAGRAALREDK